MNPGDEARGDSCPECGARVQSGGRCRDNFEALLALEWEVPGGAGGLAHFFAVSSYILQHPDTMSYTKDSLEWLRTAVGRALSGEATPEDLRRDARTAGGSGGHVTRREGDEVPRWDVERWTVSVEDVLRGGTEVYAERVRAWAASVLADLGEGRPGG